MDVEWAEISYLRREECAVCVYVLSGVSVYSHGDLAQNGQTTNKATYCQMAGGACYDSAGQTPVFFHKVNYGSC